MARKAESDGAPIRRIQSEGAPIRRIQSEGAPIRRIQDRPPGRPSHEVRSPLAEALTRVGDRWTLLVVDALQGGARRFNDLVQDVPGIAPNILSARLRQLERDAIVFTRPYSRRPLRFTYELTASGRELAGALRLLTHWGSAQSYGADEVEAPRHGACGTPMETRWYCPTCARTVEETAPEEVRYV